MTKLVSALFLVVVGLAAVTAAAPAITRIVDASIPLVLVVGVVVAVLRVLWAYTRRW